MAMTDEQKARARARDQQRRDEWRAYLRQLEAEQLGRERRAADDAEAAAILRAHGREPKS